jgi:hypothetical protein
MLFVQLVLLMAARSYQKLTLLGNGKVLAVGGAGGVNDQICAGL